MDEGRAGAIRPVAFPGSSGPRDTIRAWSLHGVDEPRSCGSSSFGSPSGRASRLPATVRRPTSPTR